MLLKSAPDSCMRTLSSIWSRSVDLQLRYVSPDHTQAPVLLRHLDLFGSTQVRSCWQLHTGMLWNFPFGGLKDVGAG